MFRWAPVILLTATALPAAEPAEPAAMAFFESKIRPLFIQHCQECHGAAKQKGGLRLDSGVHLHKSGAVVPGQPAASLLIKAVNHDGLKMPPKSKLKPEEIADLTTWVKGGAPWPATTKTAGIIDIEHEKRTYWAFQPLRKTPAPSTGTWASTDIDRFILAGLEAKGLKPVEPADKRTLIRRATYDLTGLPPTPEEVADFLKDDSPDAFARVVDRLLASPAYGERWGRHWLDVVRYADTAGDNSDYPVPQLYHYRDWVIDAFNRDLPYDQFVRQQLAGDLLPAMDDADRKNKLIATGYLANARRFGSYEDARYPWHLTIEDTIDNFGRTFLGLTVNCTRCHDHKFDPLTNEDYYALYGFFSSTRYPWPGIELDKVPKDLVPLASPEAVERITKEREEQIAPLREAAGKLIDELVDATKGLAKAERLAKEEKNENEREAALAKAKQLLVEAESAYKEKKKEYEQLANRPLPYETAYAVIDGKNEPKKRIGQIGNAKVQIKGDPERPDKEVPRRFPTVLGGETLKQTSGSGRDQLADWLVAESLFARVMANRIWHWHFGRGLVPTPSDFGKQGRPATHPELLDFLAEFFASDRSIADLGLRIADSKTHSANPQSAIGNPQWKWSLKKMHRLIMLSRTYQLSSRDDDANLKLDVDNDYLWRFRRQRLDAESIRDTLLAVSGGLERGPGGAHPFPSQSTWNFTQHRPFKDVYPSNRRSVYLMTQRIQRHPFLALFDGPDTNASTATRITSTTPLQALYLMNDPFVHEQTGKLAARLLREASDDGKRIERAYLLLYGRPATPEELATSKEYLAQARQRVMTDPAAWESLVRVLFMTNEFVYVN